jgi:hypoxanthine phosphoribosyltransferase
MRVITLLNRDFILACKDLSNKIKESFAPDIIISILTGGAYVGKMIMQELDNKNILYAEIKIQRGNTKRKELKVVHYIIKRIPQFIANWIRILESEMLLIKSKFKKPMRTGVINFEKNIDEFLRQGCKNVLIVDDSIDSGATVEFVCS